MPIEVPKSTKVYTSVYDNFKGVDFTNDATNVYKRRSPSGLNMMPNLDGKPYKRKGWEVAVDLADFNAEYTGTLGDDFAINKVHYFEMAGCDHLMIFTNAGLFSYRVLNDDESELAFLSDNSIVKKNYDRTFFFEANGETGFYIYGDYAIWKYYFDEDTNAFKLESQTPTVPRIRISVSADGQTATALDSANLLTNIVAEEFQNNNIPKILSSSSSLTFDLDADLFLKTYASARTYKFTYDDGTWVDGDGVFVTLSGVGITLTSTPSDSSTITVIVGHDYLTYLSYEVALADASQVKVYVEDTTYEASDSRYNRELTVVTSGSPSESQVLMKNVEVEEDSDIYRTVLQYGKSFTPSVDGQDCIRVEYPSVKITYTEQTFSEVNPTATRVYDSPIQLL